MKKPQKIQIQEKLGQISPYNLTLSKEEAFSIFALTPKHEYDSIGVDFEVDEYGWGTEYKLELYGYRQETDEEYAKRLEEIKKSADLLKKKQNLKLQEEKELYEKLKKKFEK